jgi:hypothetical protein
MAQLLDREALEKPVGRSERDKAVKILAKSIYRELSASGYDTRDIVALSTELIDLITSNLRPDTASK